MDSNAQNIIFDTPTFLKRRARALTLPQQRNPWFLHEYAANGNIETIETTKPNFENAIEIFSGNGFFGNEIAARNLLGDGRKIQTLNEIEPAFLSAKSQNFTDIEGIELEKNSANLIIANSCFHLVNDLPQLLLKIRAALKHDGLFIASFIGGNSLRELRQTFLNIEAKHNGGASLRIAPMIELESAVKLLSKCGFVSPVSSVESLKIGYENVFGLLRDIKAMGENAPFFNKARMPLNRKMIAEIADYYQKEFVHKENRVFATFEIVSICGWAN